MTQKSVEKIPAKSEKKVHSNPKETWCFDKSVPSSIKTDEYKTLNKTLKIEKKNISYYNIIHTTYSEHEIRVLT